MKYLKAAIAFAAAGLCASLSVINALAATTNYEVDFTGVMQAKTNWCWAASAEASAHHAYEYSNRSQYHAVYLIYGPEYPNLGGNIEQTAQAATYLAHNYVSYQYYSSMPVSEFFISQIVQDKVPIIGYIYYDENGPTSYGHMVTLKKISVNTTTGDKIFYFYDPYLDQVRHDSISNLLAGTAVYEPSVYYKFKECCYY